MKLFFPRYREIEKYTTHYLSNFLPALAERFDRLFITVNGAPKNSKSSLPDSEKIKIVEFDSHFHPYIENYLWSFGKLSQFKEFQEKSDGILMSIPSALTYSSFIPDIDKPLILLIAGSEQEVIKHRDGFFKKLITKLGDAKLREIVENTLLKKADGIITRNNPTKEWLKKGNKILPNSPIEVLPAGIETDQFSPINQGKSEEIKKELGMGEQKKVVGFVAGELSKHKGAYALRDIFKRLLKTKEDVNFLVVGSDHYNIFKDFKKRKEVIHFEQVKREKLSDFYGVMDVFLFPATEAEGAPKVLMEASSCGTPCVSTKVAGIPSIIEDGETGFLTEQGDVDALFKKCNQILDNDKLREKMGEKAREHIKQKFSFQEYISEFSDFIKEVIRKNS